MKPHILLLLIRSIFDFGLAAPVPVQKNRQTSIDVEHLPHDVVTMLGKRGSDEIEKLVEEFFGSWGRPIESSDAHASSSSAPPGSDHGGTNVAQAPAPNQGWSTANPESYEPLHHTPAQSEYGLDQVTGPHAPQPNPPSTDSYSDLNYWFPPPPRTASTEEFGQAHRYQAEDVQQPNPGLSTDSYSDVNYWFPPPPRPVSPEEFGQAHENQVENFQQPNPGPSTVSDFAHDFWTYLPDSPPPRPTSPHENQVENVQQPSPGSTDSDFDYHHWENVPDPSPQRPTPPLENQVENVQQPNPGSTYSDLDRILRANPQDPRPSIPWPLTKLESDGYLMMPAHQPPFYPPPPPPTEFYSYSDPEDEVVPGSRPGPYHQPPSTDDLPVDHQAAIYDPKGKAKQ